MKVCLVNLGCPKNQKDGEQALCSFLKSGFAYEKDPKRSDVIVVNTCGFIDEAKKESIAVILECAGLKGTKNKKVLIVMGCLSQRYPEEISKEIPEADIIFGTGTADRAYELYKKFIEKRSRVLYPSKPGFLPGDHDYISLLKGSGYVPETSMLSAYVKVAEGCSNNCAYCVIPAIRGKAVHREISDVKSEISSLSKNGVKEVVLIAQDLSSNKKYLKDLIKAISRLKGQQRPSWLRLMYCNPWGVDDELISMIKNEDFIVKYIDMPIQHISDQVLKRMGRKESSSSILKKLETLRDAGIVIRSTVMTGFPGEKASDFNKLKKVVGEGYFNWLGIFVYSPQEGTRAYSMDGRVHMDVAIGRRNELDTIQFDITSNLNEGYVGKTYPVLMCGAEDGVSIGRIFAQAPVIDGVVRLSGKTKGSNGFVKVLIEESLGYDLKGKIIV